MRVACSKLQALDQELTQQQGPVGTTTCLGSLLVTVTRESSCLQVDNVSRVLASAHTPLVLLCMGMWVKEQQPKASQVRDLQLHACRVVALLRAVLRCFHCASATYASLHMCCHVDVHLHKRHRDLLLGMLACGV